MSKNEDLKPCPFCGGKAKIKKDCCFGGDIYFVECQHCIARGPGERLKYEAIAAWNRRVCVKQNAETLDTNSVASSGVNTKLTYADIKKMVMPLDWKYERRAINGVVYEAYSALDYMFAVFSDDNSAYWTGRFWNNRQCGVAKTAEEIKSEAQKSLVDLVAAALGVERSGE